MQSKVEIEVDKNGIDMIIIGQSMSMFQFSISILNILNILNI